MASKPSGSGYGVSCPRPAHPRKVSPTMNHQAHTSPAARELEVIVRRLWTTEPRCPPAERTSLLTELGSIGLALERIILRDENQSTRTVTNDLLRPEHLAECERRIQHLLERWPVFPEARSPPLVAA